MAGYPGNQYDEALDIEAKPSEKLVIEYTQGWSESPS